MTDLSRPLDRPQASIILDRITIRFDQQTVLEDLSLSFAPGKIHALMGQSGVGKSSLLRLMAELSPLEKGGRISLSDGRALADQCTMMFQEDNLLPWAKLLDNVTIGSRLRGETPDINKVARLIEQLGLSEHENKYPDQLSGGMRQRAALARTLMEDQPIVLMDEPFSALDALTRMKLQDLAVQLLKDKTIILVTHDPTEALRIADTITVLQPDGSAPKALSSDLREVLGPTPVHPAHPEFSTQMSELLYFLGLSEEALS